MILRVLLAIASLVSGGVHLQLWFDGFRQLDVIGPAFLLNAVAGGVIAVLLLVWRSWIPLFLAVGLGASVLLAFTISTTPMGLFGVRERWSGGPQIIGAISEVVLVVAGVWAARAEGWIGASRQGRD